MSENTQEQQKPVPLMLRLEPELAEALRLLAKENRRSLNMQIALLLENLPDVSAKLQIIRKRTGPADKMQ